MCMRVRVARESSCLSMRGIFRRADQCKNRFRLVTHSGTNGTEAGQEKELVVGGVKVDKTSARQMPQN